MRAALPALATVLLCGGCGGGSNAEQVVRDFSKALNESDGERVCNELVTQKFAEQITLAQSDTAREQCTKQIGVLKGQAFEVVKILKTTEKGDSATVRAEIEQQGQRRPQLFRLKKEDGELRLTSSE